MPIVAIGAYLIKLNRSVNRRFIICAKYFNVRKLGNFFYLQIFGHKLQIKSFIESASDVGSDRSANSATATAQLLF